MVLVKDKINEVSNIGSIKIKFNDFKKLYDTLKIIPSIDDTLNNIKLTSTGFMIDNTDEVECPVAKCHVIKKLNPSLFEDPTQYLEFVQKS